MSTINLREAARDLTLKIASYAKQAAYAPVDFIRDPANIGLMLAYLASVFFGPYLYYFLPNTKSGYAVAQAGLALLIVPPVRQLAVDFASSAVSYARRNVTFNSAAASSCAVAAIAYGVYIYSAELQSTAVVNMMIAAINSIKNVPGSIPDAIGISLGKAMSGLGWVNMQARLSAVWDFLGKFSFLAPGGNWVGGKLQGNKDGVAAITALFTASASKFFLDLPQYASDLLNSGLVSVGALGSVAAMAATGEDPITKAAAQAATTAAAQAATRSAAQATAQAATTATVQAATKLLKPGTSLRPTFEDLLNDYRWAPKPVGWYDQITSVVDKLSESLWALFASLAPPSNYQLLSSKIVALEKSLNLSNATVPYYISKGYNISQFDPQALSNLTGKGIPKESFAQLTKLYFEAAKESEAGISRLASLRGRFLSELGVANPEALSPEQLAEYAKLPIIAEREPTIVENVFEFLQSLRDMATRWIERFLGPIRDTLEEAFGPFWAKIALIFGLCIAAVGAYFLFRAIYNLRYGKNKSVEPPARKAFTVVSNIIAGTDAYVTTMYKVITETPAAIVEQNAVLVDKVIERINKTPANLRDNFSNAVLNDFQTLRNQRTPADVVLGYLRIISSLSERVNERIEAFMLLGDDTVTEQLPKLRSSLTVMYSCFSIIKVQATRK